MSPFNEFGSMPHLHSSPVYVFLFASVVQSSETALTALSSMSCAGSLSIPVIPLGLSIPTVFSSAYLPEIVILCNFGIQLS